MYQRNQLLEVYYPSLENVAYCDNDYDPLSEKHPNEDTHPIQRDDDYDKDSRCREEKLHRLVHHHNIHLRLPRIECVHHSHEGVKCSDYGVAVDDVLTIFFVYHYYHLYFGKIRRHFRHY